MCQNIYSFKIIKKLYHDTTLLTSTKEQQTLFIQPAALPPEPRAQCIVSHKTNRNYSFTFPSSTT